MIDDDNYDNHDDNGEDTNDDDDGDDEDDDDVNMHHRTHTHTPYHPWDWSIYLHLSYKSTIHVGKYTVRPMDGMGTVSATSQYCDSQESVQPSPFPGRSTKLHAIFSCKD